MHRTRSILIGIAVGLVVGVTTLIYWEAIPRGTFARRVFDIVFYPEGVVVSGLSHWLSPDKPDRAIAYWLILHPVYCMLVGGFIGLGATWLSRPRSDRPKA